MTTANIDDVRARARATYWFLRQTRWWKNREGALLELAEMSPRYKANCLPFLERRAANLEFYYSMGEVDILSDPIPTVGGPPMDNMPSGQMAQDAYEREQDERHRDPVKWLRTTPLYCEIKRQVDAGEGGSVGEPGA